MYCISSEISKERKGGAKEYHSAYSYLDPYPFPPIMNHPLPSFISAPAVAGTVPPVPYIHVFSFFPSLLSSFANLILLIIILVPPQSSSKYPPPPNLPEEIIKHIYEKNIAEYVGGEYTQIPPMCRVPIPIINIIIPVIVVLEGRYTSSPKSPKTHPQLYTYNTYNSPSPPNPQSSQKHAQPIHQHTPHTSVHSAGGT